jgi:hypothetical protein
VHVRVLMVDGVAWHQADSHVSRFPCSDSYPLLAVFWTIFEVFPFVIRFWILIWVFIDIFRSP